MISADSLQVYRGLDIGTAKPSPAFRSRLRHHLMDIADPDEQFQAGDFVRLADRALAGISAAGRTAVISGGAAYYLKQLLFGLSDAPASTPAARAAVSDRLREEGLAGLYRRLEHVDPATARRVGPADEYRITRALEVYQVSGRPLSDFPPPASPRDELRALLIALERPRDELYRRIDRRVERMFDDGLRDEVERLVAAGYGSQAPGMRGIGYREFFGPDGELRPGSEDPQILRLIQRNSRRYAKRQITFFRSLPGVRWCPADAEEEVAALIGSFSGLLDSR